MDKDFLKKYQDFVNSITRDSYDDDEKKISNFGLGIAGEAGDVASCIKKTIFHKNEQIEGVKENLGDTLWYIAAICNHYGWSLEEVFEGNISKLSKRYPNGFSFKAAKRKGEKIDWNEKEK
ncbi:MAG: nucleoside triphosphate pyrophosphohydrolase family protein [Candidatus Diapherotrites archaeon]|nr:nucleoside triphosphate pyrophosphohydrolase family protein [Candidatus Diapherotrites archaeon]